MASGDGGDAPAHVLLASLSSTLFLIVLIPSLVDGYGYFIDELYYIACSERLALGYVDHPPLAPLLLRLARAVFGDSTPAIRLLPALSGAASVYLTGLMAHRLGAGRFGQGLAALCLMVAPVPLILFGFFSMNAFEILLWTGACFVLVELARTGEARLWLVFGLVAGVGLQNKHTFVLLVAGLAVGLLLTVARRELASRWLWVGAALTFVIVAPNLWWQIAHGWPSLEFYRNADLYKNVPTPPLTVLMNQILFMNPGTLIVWLAGLGFFLASRAGRPYRFIGWMAVALLFLMIAGQRSRPDRIVGAYPVLFAAGAVWWETRVRVNGIRWVRWALPSIPILVGLALAPLSLPVLPPDQLARYSAAAGIVPKLERGDGKVSELPQWFADRFGWEEFVATVTEVVGGLDPTEAAHALILVPSYGHAGAIELLGTGRALPRVASPHNTYYLWGFGEREPEVVVAVGYEREVLTEFFEDVQQAATARCDYCMSWRREMPVHVARGPRGALGDVWPQLKHYE